VDVLVKTLMRIATYVSRAVVVMVMLSLCVSVQLVLNEASRIGSSMTFSVKKSFVYNS